MSRRLPFAAGSTGLWLFFVAAHGHLVAVPRYDPFGTQRFGWSLILLGSFLLLSYAAGLPELPKTRSSAVFWASTTMVASILVLSAAQLMLGQALLPRWTMLGLAITWPSWALVAWHLVIDRDHRRASNVLFVGHPDTFAELRRDAEEAERLIRFVGSVPMTETTDEAAEDLSEAAASLHPDVLVLDTVAQSSQEIVGRAAVLHGQGVRIRTPSLFAEENFGKIPVADLERTSLLFDIGELHRTQYVRLKRIVEVAVAAVGIVLLAPGLPLVMVANLVGNRGPLFYSQPRVGKGGSEFVIWKLRTMRSAAESVWTQECDDRITPIGSLLRRSHVDELPQLWNILRGDLSLVGPRPEQPQYVTELCEKIPYFATRHLVRPGLTGWAQVKAPYAASESDAREKLQFDLYYLRHQSAALDLRIVVRTLRSVLRAEGR